MPRRVLIVDDDELNRRYLGDLCTKEGFQIRTARDGWEALEHARSERPDVVLLDIVMPRLDGYEACARMKAEQHLAEVPILMCTALDDPESRLKALDAGADDYLTKPFDADRVLERIRRALQFKNARERLKAARMAEASADATPRGIGDYADLRRDLSVEMARADRHETPLACVALVPREGLAPEGSPRLLWLAGRCDAVRRGLRDSDRLYLLGDEEIIALLPDCDGDGAGAAVGRIGAALGDESVRLALGSAVHRKGETDNLLRRARAAALEGGSP